MIRFETILRLKRVNEIPKLVELPPSSRLSWGRGGRPASRYFWSIAGTVQLGILEAPKFLETPNSKILEAPKFLETPKILDAPQNSWKPLKIP